MREKKEKTQLINQGFCLEEIRTEEEKYILNRQQAAGVKNSMSIGLALSGGGIRAACFALGVINSMELSGHWKRIDYISSVSGGGYAASGVLAIKEGEGCYLNNKTRAERVLEKLTSDDNGYVELTPRILAAIPLGAVSMVLSLALLLLLIAEATPLMIGSVEPQKYDQYVNLAGVGFCILFRYIQLFISKIKRRKNSDGDYWFMLAAGFCALQVSYWAGHSKEGVYRAAIIGVCLIWLLVGSILNIRPSHSFIRKLHGWAYYLIGFAVFLSAGLAVQWVFGHLARQVALRYIGFLDLVFLGIAFFALIVSPNVLSLPIKIYYKGLRKKFGDMKEKDVHIYSACKSIQNPIHLINCFSPSSMTHDMEKKYRGGENFCISSLYCGMNSIGYFSTKDWYVGKKWKRWNHQLIWNLAVTSGAAVDTHPVKQSPLKNLLIMLFNIGLGRWVINPAYHLDCRTWWPPFYRHLMGALGIHSNHAKWLRLSDGGHFDNLGIYELIARECMDIVVVDAGFDPNYEFVDLAYVVQRCHEDFGADIDIPNIIPRININDNEKVILRGRVHYKGKSMPGRLTIIKLGVAGWHSLPLRLRASIDKYFPHEPTVNQFPNQEFIKTYYNLGKETATQALLKI